ncbi:MAG: CvpA family protein [Lachnospiraceae bacterium]
MNWLIIVMLVLIIWRIVSGAESGLIKELLSFLGMLFLGTAVGLILVGVQGYFDENIVQMTITIVLIVILAVVHSVLKLIIFPAKVIAKIPIISIVDKLFGILFGILEICIVYWVCCLVFQQFELGTIEIYFDAAVKEVEVLGVLREANLIVWLVELAKEQIAAIPQSILFIL